MRHLVEDGPRAADLVPSRRGVAVIANGGVGASQAGEILDLLMRGWPAVVLRQPPQAPVDAPAPVVPIRLLIPGRLFPPQGRGVYQPMGSIGRHRIAGDRPAAGSVVLPAAPRRTIQALLGGRRPAATRWLRAWRAVWGMAW